MNEQRKQSKGEISGKERAFRVSLFSSLKQLKKVNARFFPSVKKLEIDQLVSVLLTLVNFCIGGTGCKGKAEKGWAAARRMGHSAVTSDAPLPSSSD